MAAEDSTNNIKEIILNSLFTLRNLDKISQKDVYDIMKNLDNSLKIHRLNKDHDDNKPKRTLLKYKKGLLYSGLKE